MTEPTGEPASGATPQASGDADVRNSADPASAVSEAGASGESPASRTSSTQQSFRKSHPSRTSRLASALRATYERVRADRVLVILLVAFAVLQFARPASAGELWRRIDLHTILTLAGLLMLTRAIDQSGFLDWLAQRLLRAFRTERRLALLMVMFAAALSTLLTNDVALFAVVPLAQSLARIAPVRIERLIIFLALAVNAGSSLTPLGNPQNLFLWQHSGMGFGAYIAMMAPITFALMAVLLAMCAAAFDSRALHFQRRGPSHDVRWPLLWTALALFVGFVGLADHGHAAWACAGVAAVLLFARRNAVLGIDWLLLAIFVLMFVVLRGVAELSEVRATLGQVDFSGNAAAYAGAALLSQVISNVPAAILLAEYSRNWPALAHGVAVGGFGLAVGSLANLIALRMAKSRQIWWHFHWVSVPFFLMAFLLGYVALKWV
ncbi:SLC13 family permease [Pandoraea pulmonicola]|uniref:Inner membrane protein YbiR n=1 Tax=Pandoraea pulmonicola TaxID=93221 RepID=A0AAJ5D113_PANPU|nr:SLC13 family permease [Pandoraea pulmonicola]SUA91130.1 Inner membrane protein YbiR [Pandoraea pulmonicola]